MSIRTIAANYYTTPDANEIKKVANQVGINQYSKNLVEDLANVISGGQFTSTEFMKESIFSNINLDLQKDVDGEYRKGNGDYTNNYQEALDSYVEKELKYHQTIQEFIKELDLSKLKGNSSLEKALNCIKMLADNVSESGDKDSTGDNVIPIFQKSNKATKKLASNLNEAIDLVEKLDREDKELLDLADCDEENVAKLIDNNLIKLILEVSASMDKFTSIKTKPASKLKLDSEGDIKQNRVIRDFSEIKKLNKKELINNKKSLAMRIINHEANVTEKYKREFKIPFVNVICDDSGSMSDNNKDKKAIGIIYNIIKRVMRNECWVSLSFFEQSCHKFYLLPSDEVELKYFFNKIIKKHRFDNGVTDVKNCIYQSIKEFNEICENNPNISKKDSHLIVINDGQDDCGGLMPTDLSGCKLHGFILDSSNEDIKRVCNATGGVYKENI